VRIIFKTLGWVGDGQIQKRGASAAMLRKSEGVLVLRKPRGESV